MFIYGTLSFLKQNNFGVLLNDLVSFVIYWINQRVQRGTTGVKILSLSSFIILIQKNSRIYFF